MNFEEFKKRYREKYEKLGATDLPDEDVLATIYMGFVIFIEWQHEDMEKARQTAMKKAKPQASQIILPGRKH